MPFPTSEPSTAFVERTLGTVDMHRMLLRLLFGWSCNKSRRAGEGEWPRRHGPPRFCTFHAQCQGRALAALEIQSLPRARTLPSLDVLVAPLWRCLGRISWWDGYLCSRRRLGRGKGCGRQRRAVRLYMDRWLANTNTPPNVSRAWHQRVYGVCRPKAAVAVGL